MKYAICNETYQGWELEWACEHAARCGYDGIEIAPYTLDDDPSRLDERRAEAVGHVVRRAGLEMVGLHWLLVRPEGLHLTSPDDEVRRRTGKFVGHLIRLCAAMGGRVMVWGSPRQRSVAEGDDPEAAFQRAADLLRDLCETADGAGVTVALEPLAPRLTNFLNTAAETVRLIEAVDHPACRLHLDVAAMSSEGRPIEQIIREHAHHLVHFHANDPNQRGPGTGDVDYRPIVSTLRDVGYQGYLSVEVFDYTPDAETIASEAIAYLRSVCEG